MKILLLGKNGMLGSELHKQLQDLDLTATDKNELDITNQNAVKQYISDLKPKFVINAAAYTDVDGCETHEAEAFLINAKAVKYLAQACKKNNSTLIHFSTDYVFDGEKKEGYNEDDAKNPLSVYGKSKAHAEDYIQGILENFYIIRTSWLFGPRGKNFVDMILKITKKRDEINVVSDQIGSPTYTIDLAKATLHFLKNSPAYGIYHRTNSGTCSWAKFAEEIMHLIKMNTKIVQITTSEFPRPAIRPRFSILLNNKLFQLRHWKEALRDYLPNNKNE